MTDPGSINRPRRSPVGIIVTIILGLGVIGLGGWLYYNSQMAPGAQAPTATTTQQSTTTPTASNESVDVPNPVEPSAGSPQIEAAAAYVPKNNVVEIDISEYAGYGGLIVANGGLAPNPDSFFAKEYGFQVKLSVSEEETWGKLNNGKFAAAATTGRNEGVVDSGADIGAMEAPPEEAVIAEEPEAPAAEAAADEAAAEA